jgi:putative spermidine/putrescine transport system ATP-binding protein
VNHVPPKEPDIAMVFQNYALYPHMSVADNMAFSLKLKGAPKAEIAQKVDRAAAILGLEKLLDRYPRQLSGGQRQRVALARAIVNRPRVLLLDEPLGALDLKLRQEMQGFLKALQQELRITFVYVTHDQEEALTMSDRLAVFNDGRIEQVGTPKEVYEQPLTEFVAGFVGVSNIVEEDGRRYTVRPEKIRISAAGDGRAGTIANAVFVGMFTRYVVVLDDGTRLTVVRQNDTSPMEQDAPVVLEWSSDDVFEIPEPPKEEG